MKVPLTYLVITLKVVLATSVMCAAESVDPSLDSCNSKYHAMKFEEAIACYQQHTPDEYSAAVFYNIGNSYAQLNQPGYSILYFMRASMLAPGDADISGNLAMIRDRYGLFPPDTSMVKQLVNLLTLSQWSMLTLLSLIVYLIYAVTRVKKKSGLLTESIVILSCLLVFGAGIFGAMSRYKEWHRGVIVRESKLLVSPFEGASSIGSIKAGRLVYPSKQYGGFWYVTDEAGRNGWLNREVVKHILPH